MSGKVKKNYKKHLYVKHGDCSFTKEEFDAMYDDKGWKSGYFNQVKKKVLSVHKKMVTATKKHNGVRSRSVYLKCSICHKPAAFKDDTKPSDDNEGKVFTFSSSCACTTANVDGKSDDD